MSQYTELSDYIKQLAESDPLINKVTQGDVLKIDFNKMNITPLFHIDINNGDLNGGGISFNVDLVCLNLLDENKEINTDEFYLNDNRVDIINECLAVLNRVWSRMLLDFDEKNISVSDTAPWEELSGIEGVGVNGLIGVKLSFSVLMPNIKISLCQYPIS